MTHSDDLIRVHGASENNLKNINVETPKRGLTVFTGVSGSGKCSPVFATIAGESQRMVADPRTTVGTVTSARPRSQAFSFNIPSVRGGT